MTKRIVSNYIFCREKGVKTPSYEFSDKFDEEVTNSYILSIVSRADYSETFVQDKLNCEIEFEFLNVNNCTIAWPESLNNHLTKKLNKFEPQTWTISSNQPLNNFLLKINDCISTRPEPTTIPSLLTIPNDDHYKNKFIDPEPEQVSQVTKVIALFLLTIIGLLFIGFCGCTTRYSRSRKRRKNVENDIKMQASLISGIDTTDMKTREALGMLKMLSSRHTLLDGGGMDYGGITDNMFESSTHQYVRRYSIPTLPENIKYKENSILALAENYSKQILEEKPGDYRISVEDLRSASQHALPNSDVEN